jgi:hypothetical protein
MFAVLNANRLSPHSAVTTPAGPIVQPIVNPGPLVIRRLTDHAMAVGFIHTVSHMWPSGSSKLRPYMKPKS